MTSRNSVIRSFEEIVLNLTAKSEFDDFIPYLIVSRLFRSVEEVPCSSTHQGIWKIKSQLVLWIKQHLSLLEVRTQTAAAFRKSTKAQDFKW